MSEPKTIHVAVGVIRNAEKNILLSKRADHVHMGGRWEFPGGKVESGESVLAALLRELHEELGITFPAFLLEKINTPTLADFISPLINIEHSYPTKNVYLHVYTIVVQESWLPGHLKNNTQQTIGEEKQPCAWVKPCELTGLTFPDANKPIVDAILLPRVMPISQDFGSLSELKLCVQSYRNSGYDYFQLRSKVISHFDYMSLLSDSALGNDLYSQVVVNCEYRLFSESSFKHLHLTSAQLTKVYRDNVTLEVKGWLSASCHNLDELDMAQALGVDYVFFSPVLPTQSHPNVQPKGWDALAAFCLKARVPVYSLGGMKKEYIEKAISCGAQGVAGISGF